MRNGHSVLAKEGLRVTDLSIPEYSKDYAKEVRIMDLCLRNIFNAFEEREATEQDLISQLELNEYMDRRDEFLISIGRESGTLINLLAKAAKARRILELGTCYGYSTLWLADAARATGGTVTTCEIIPAKLRSAQETIAKSGLATYVDFQLGDALETIGRFTECFDFVLLDLWKDTYISAFDAFYPKLNDGAYVVADNMLSPERYKSAAVAYRTFVNSKSGITSVLLPIGNGLELSRYENSGPAR